MSLLVVKFGGTSVANIPAIENVADKVAAEVSQGHKVVVVVSAMAGVTNQLVSWCEEVNPEYDLCEYDSVVSSGEQVSSGLLALALQRRKVKARSWMGWQVPIRTSNTHRKARIKSIDARALHECIANDEVPVLAGFQGIGDDGRVATLGRGGSDTSAVAVAAAIKADRCDIYTDVDGVYTADPRIVNSARKLAKVSYEEMLEMASVGAKVLQTRSVEMAMKMQVPVQVLSSFENYVGSDMPGTVVESEENIVEQEVISGVTYARDEAKITLSDLPDIPGVAAQVFGPLAAESINVDMIVQNVSSGEEKTTDLTFTVPRGDLPRAQDVLKRVMSDVEGVSLSSSADVAKVSIVGIGMRSHAGVAQKMFQTLAEKGINIQVISTSEIKVSVLVAEEYLELAVRALHTAYDLDREEESAE